MRKTGMAWWPWRDRRSKEGAHVLDVNVDYVGRDGERDMHELVSRLVTNVTLPLMLDSTEWTKMEAGLKVAGGKCILNSTNYEDGDERFFKVLELAKKYGAGIVIGTIDEDGMARTAEKKFQIAQRAYRDALEYGIPARELFFDTLALPISTGIEEDRVNGRETIESIRMIRENLPGCHIMLGVSNVSFWSEPGGAGDAELGVPPRSHAGGAGWSHRQCRQNSAPGQDRPRPPEKSAAT